jgi:hypothetical protein
MHFASQLKRQGVPCLRLSAFLETNNTKLMNHKCVCKAKVFCGRRKDFSHHAINFLPDDCEFIAFIDCDIIFSCDDWHEKTIDVLNKCDVAQVFQKCGHLVKGDKRWDGDVVEDRHPALHGKALLIQIGCGKEKQNELPWAHPGFGWAFRREFIQDLGFYDKSIVGGGDTILADCLFDGFYIHKFTQKYNVPMIDDIMQYCEKIKSEKSNNWLCSGRNRSSLSWFSGLKKLYYKVSIV